MERAHVRGVCGPTSLQSNETIEVWTRQSTAAKVRREERTDLVERRENKATFTGKIRQRRAFESSILKVASFRYIWPGRMPHNSGLHVGHRMSRRVQ